MRDKKAVGDPKVAADRAHLQAWAGLHQTEVPTGFVGGWVSAMAAMARPLARWGVSPNMVTVAALGVSMASVPLARRRGPWACAGACAVVTVAGVMDSLDGAVALAGGRTTKAGFLLDSALDRLADAVLATALAVSVATRRPHHAAAAARLAVAATGTAWWMEYVRARATLASVPERQIATPGERPTRITLTAIALALPRLAPASLKGQVLMVGASAIGLFGWSLRRLAAEDSVMTTVDPVTTTGSEEIRSAPPGFVPGPSPLAPTE